MKTFNIESYRESLKEENISYGELIEIEGRAFDLGIDTEGMMASDILDEIENFDLFEHPEKIPQEVKDVLDEYQLAENDYDTCMDLVENLNTVGYTCDYGLDAVPFNLRPL